MHERHGRKAFPGNVSEGEIPTTRTTVRHHHRSRPDIHIGPMERNHEEVGNRKKAEPTLLPPNRRTNGTDQFHFGTIPPSLRQLSAGRLEGAPTNGRIRLQQWIYGKHQAQAILRELWNEPRISGHRTPDPRKNDVRGRYELIT